jgi:hypothetical protein
MTSLSDLRSQLIAARAAKADADAVLADLLEANSLIKLAMENAAAASSAVKEADAELRAEIQATYFVQGRDAVKAVQGLNVRIKPDVKIENVAAAETWARHNMNALLMLDTKAFKNAWTDGLIQRIATPEEIALIGISETEVVTPTIAAELE